ncbi:hypothetical protein GCM10027157_13100 [Corynebacterium aquatimens]
MIPGSGFGIIPFWIANSAAPPIARIAKVRPRPTPRAIFCSFELVASPPATGATGVSVDVEELLDGVGVEVEVPVSAAVFSETVAVSPAPGAADT